MKIKGIAVGILDTNCYLVEEKGFSAVIDPGGDPSFIEQAIKENLSCAPTHIILTHGHFDHVGALKNLHNLYPDATIAISEKTALSTSNIKLQAQYIFRDYYFQTCFSAEDFEIPKPNLLLKNGDLIGPFKVLYTPGHTEDSICLYSEKDAVLFSGDTLFCGNYGRTDLGGSFEDIKKSLKKILELPKDTKVFPGHGENTTIGSEQALLFNI